MSSSVDDVPRSPTLRAVLAQAAADPAGARASLELALRRSGGPLVELLADEPGRGLVAFVATRAGAQQPRVQSQLFPSFLATAPMRALSGLDGVWWAETTAPLDAATLYQFESGPEIELDADAHVDPAEIERFVRAHWEVTFADPWNDERCYPMDALTLFGGGPPPPWRKWSCVVRLPEAPPFDWHGEPARRGRLETFAIGSRLLGNTRSVSVWTPPGAADGPLPLVVLLDGETFLLGMDAPRIFDNLVERRAAPPFVAACVHNATPTSRLGEYACDDAFAGFLADELVPELRRRYALRTEAASTTIGGYSLGGLAACWAGHVRPELFGNVAAFSPSLWWDGPSGQEPEWLTHRYAGAAGEPPRVWLEVGTLEGAPLPAHDGLSMLRVARRLRDVLAERGTALAGYRERAGGHDCVNWRQGLAEALSALLGGAS